MIRLDQIVANLFRRFVFGLFYIVICAADHQIHVHGTVKSSPSLITLPSKRLSNSTSPTHTLKLRIFYLAHTPPHVVGLKCIDIFGICYDSSTT